MIDSLLYMENGIEKYNEMIFFLQTKTDKLFIANNKKEGLRIFKKYQPSLLICDINLSKQESLEFIKNIFCISQNVYIIAFITSDKNLLQAIDIGVKEYIVKPIDFLKLSDKIKHISNLIEKQKRDKIYRKLLKDYKKAIDKTTIFIKMDKQGRFTYVNDKFCNILSISKENLLGKTFVDFELYGAVFEQITQTLKDKNSWKGEININSIEDYTIILDGAFFPIHDLKNPNECAIGIFQDITELSAYRKIIKNRLDKTTLNLKDKLHYFKEENKILEIGIASCKIDNKGKIKKSNRAFNDLFHFPENITPKESFLEILDFPTDQFKLLCKTLNKQTIYKDIFTVKYLEQTFNLIYIGIYGISKNLEYIVIFFDDISKILDHKQAR